jgi:sugar lactone lactonase YvrE
LNVQLSTLISQLSKKMKKYILFSLLFSLACLVWQCKDNPTDEVKPDEPKPRYTTVSTFAGGGAGTGAVDGTGTAARFSDPYSITKDSQGNFFVVDNGNQVIRKITPAGVVTTFAGTSGQSGDADGTGATARFRNPTGICIDASDNLYVGEFLGNRIRKITPAGVVTTFVGSTTGAEGSTDATGTAARFRGVSGLTIDTQGNLYVADGNNSSVRKVTSAGVVTTLTTNISIRGIFFSPQGELFTCNNQINKINLTTGVATPFAGVDVNSINSFADGQGLNAKFNSAAGMSMDTEGNLYVADGNNSRIRKVTPSALVSTLAGNGTQGSANGAIATATLAGPVGIYVDRPSNTIYFTDISNDNIRKID